MQRINYYPSPLTPLTNDGKSSSQYGAYDVNIDDLEAGTYVFAADIKNNATQTGTQVTLFNSNWVPLFNSDNIGHVKTAFTFEKAGRLVIRAQQPGATISNVTVERADTYDAAVGGGASGLLHGRHDAARIGASVGRVMSDDDREHLPGNKGENTGRTALASEVRGRTQRQLLRSLHCGKCWENANDRQAIRHLQLVHFAGNCRERTCVRCRHLACQLWRFGHHCDRHHDLRELQCHEKDIRRAGNNRIQRGYHATRLTLMGVMA